MKTEGLLERWPHIQPELVNSLNNTATKQSYVIFPLIDGGCPFFFSRFLSWQFGILVMLVDPPDINT